MNLRVLAFAGIGFLSLGVAGNSVNAALLASESFNYAAGSNLTGLNGGFGFGGAYTENGIATRTIAAGSLNYPSSVSYVPAGNSAQIATTGEFFAQTKRTLGSSASLADNSAGTRYISFLLNSAVLPANYAQVGLGGSDAYVTFGFDGSQFALEGTGAAKVTFGAPVANTTYLFVGKVVNNGTTSVASLNVYGPSDTVPGTEGSFQATTSSFNSVALNGFYGFQGQNATLRLDEIRIGDSYADVVAVPEPTSMAVLGLLSTGLLARRNRAGK